MKCPFCENDDTKVVDSRPADDGYSIRRRRECEKCGKRFTTYEKVEEVIIMVVKKDGSRETFDRNKLMGGIISACQKRPVSMSAIEALVSDVEHSIFNTMEKEVTSNFIGEKVMEGLEKLDQVAYVRFASVYRQFADVHTFISEIERLVSK